MARTVPRGWQELEIKDFLKFTPREVEKPKVKYRSLGIRSHCKGTFVREVENPDKVMMETLYAVKKNDLIVNITFAWEGAVAIVNKSNEGALVSHRFPTYVFDRDVAVPEFFRYLIPSKRFVYNLGVISPGGAGRNRVLDRKDFYHLQFIMPPVEEQKIFAEILSTWDRAIETLGKLIETKVKLKKGLMQKLLTGKVRFKEFKSEQWQHVKISELCKINYGKSQKGLPSGKYKIYGTGGVVGTTKTYLYNKPSVIIGRKGTIDTPIYIEEPFYPIDTVFYVSFKEGILPKWFYYQLRMIDLKRYNETSGVPSLNREALYKIKINIASLREQNKISSFFSVADRELEYLSHTFETIKKQKKGLMQKLLTGKIRVKI
ncbi:MAG: restriction endonuclease subunit S [Candidatus Omnitrophica bacterium]|nr:restriction endonuclease subunit S [Candidatus Omnitrophota bacterium]MBU4457930.1 restriction endonuclease subunit S [Candidatus Omnitrophota bacterium]